MIGADIKKKLNIADIGYYGKPLDTLSRDDLIGLCLHLSRILYECPHKGHVLEDRRNTEE